MRNPDWENALYDHQHSMIKRLDSFRKQANSKPYDSDEMMIIEHSFQLLVASMLDLARYVLKHHYQVEVSSREDVLEALVNNKDVTFEQAEQIKYLIKLRDIILHDYLEENFDQLAEAMTLRRYSLVEVLTKEWITRLSSLDN
ncbi:HepT-like ribonuclease domain-containing protein [Marinomonas sp. THO17]|uniref:HepT-like ribonuclease domain-containing protein n=1 Tax=Marinomonas sp. THO17 TaxID=3149048 RepID=UPI00336BC645